MCTDLETINNINKCLHDDQGEDIDINSDLIRITDMAVDEFRLASKTLKSKFMNQMDCRLSEIIDDVSQAFAKSSIDSTKAFLVSDSTHMHPNHAGDNRISESNLTRSGKGKTNNENKEHVKPKLPDKEFQLRQSPLTELLEVPHFRTIHHIFIASLILMFLHTMLKDLSETGAIDLGLDSLLWAFGEPSKALRLILMEYFLSIFVLYPSFNYWASLRGRYTTQKSQQFFDKIAAVAFVAFFTGFIFIPGIFLWRNPLPFASALVVTMEQARLLMKMYAFVRSNVFKVLEFNSVPVPTIQRTGDTKENKSDMKTVGESPYESEAGNCTSSCISTVQLRKINKLSDNFEDNKNEGEGQSQEKNVELIVRSSSQAQPNKQRPLQRYESWISWESEGGNVSPCPDFTKYLYFLFAPTLIYKDHYPRTNRIRWNYVFWNFAQCIGCGFYMNFILSRFLSTKFANLGLKGHEMNLRELLQTLFSLMLPGTLTLVMSFFTILHAWQNAFAEMLYFGDRMFYKDWWNSSSFGMYYKTWNLLVHDWLYTYIFKDACESEIGKISKALPTILVFVVSSLFHEYILIVSFHLFFPVNLVLFGGFGFVFLFVGDRKKKTAIGNILMWMALMSGTGIIVAAYSMELYASINCPSTPDSSFFVPRIIACGAIKFSWN